MKRALRAAQPAGAFIAEGAFTTAVDEFDYDRIKTKKAAKEAAEKDIRIQSAMRGAAGSSDIPPKPGIINRGGVRTIAYDITEKMLQEEKDRERDRSQNKDPKNRKGILAKLAESVSRERAQCRQTSALAQRRMMLT